MAQTPKTREDGKIQIFTPFITKNGKRIYRPDGKMWMFWGDPNYDRKPANDENQEVSHVQED
jgi:hypothetical protein